MALREFGLVAMISCIHRENEPEGLFRVVQGLYMVQESESYKGVNKSHDWKESDDCESGRVIA
jgi:hypothetical protein